MLSSMDGQVSALHQLQPRQGQVKLVQGWPPHARVLQDKHLQLLHTTIHTSHKACTQITRYAMHLNPYRDLMAGTGCISSRKHAT